jgi:excisionase family DNA binding protein
MHLTARLIHALPINERRVFSRAEAASYAGVSLGHFKKLVEDGILPEPLPGYGRVRRWDKAALDRALDNASGAATFAPTQSAYDAWRSARG